jgi:hypothetical protein
MSSVRKAALCFAVCSMLGCVDQDAPTDVTSEASAIDVAPVTTTSRERIMPDEISVQRAIEGVLVPADCVAFQTIYRMGPAEGTFRAFGVCVRPYSKIVFQAVGDMEDRPSASGAPSGNSLLALQSALAVKTVNNAGRFDHSTGAGGLFPKGGPPQPGGTEGRVVIAVAHRLQIAYDNAEAALKEATPTGTTAGY